ncbi:MAG: hypothetical protein WC777_02780 [Candidatus Gracilibacteria bacterium]
MKKSLKNPMKNPQLLMLAGVLVLGLGAFALSDADFLEGRWGKVQSVDTDGDGLTDALEADLGTDPKEKDSDGGGAPDGTELANKMDPLDSADDVITAQIMQGGNDGDLDDAQIDQPKEDANGPDNTQPNPTGSINE